MMVDQPRIEIELQLSETWQTSGPLANRALEVAHQISNSMNLSAPFQLHIEVLQVPLQHSGLGTGTQLALSIALGIHQLLDLTSPSANELATITSRGRRSAVGTHGFLHGGLIWETGQQQPSTLGTLAKHLSVPTEWRILLIRLPQQPGLHGDREITAFKNLPPIPSEVTNKLRDLAEQTILPAVQTADFQSFSKALYEYGHLSGSCFADVQGGPFASQAISHLIAFIRNQGIQGVGQSSWGPTVFAFVEDEFTAQQLATHLLNQPEFADAAITITPAASKGAI